MLMEPSGALEAIVIRNDNQVFNARYGLFVCRDIWKEISHWVLELDAALQKTGWKAERCWKI